ncbi:hypothetical protein [Mycolicibacterium sp.]|uniref:hypothetical protein n=1 Tax=Mycolicibacterium sp. TaxID=2320850 RepID=UPI003D10EFD9
MTALVRLRDAGSRTWSAATWSAPLLSNLVLAVLIVTSWLLGRVYPAFGPLGLFLVSAAAVFLVCAVAVVALVRSASPRADGIALGVIGSYAVVFVGGFVYGFWILKW